MEQCDFVAIDFETANRSFDSACSIGIAAVKDFKVVDTYYSLINPRAEFDAENIRVHGITPDDVKNAPTAYDVWREIAPFFGRYAVLAHNAHFDMSVLKQSFPFIADVDFKYIDTISLCKEVVPGKKSLLNCADYFNIDSGQHHNGLDDAVTCAKIAIACIKASGYDNLGALCFSLPNVRIDRFVDLNPFASVDFRGNRRIPAYSKVRPCDIDRTIDAAEINPDNPFFGKIVVFTGELQMGRAEAMQAVVNLGASVRGAVSRKTNYLVVGRQDQQLVGESGISSKEMRAADLNEMGFAHIEIIDEKQFQSMIQGEFYNG